MGWLKEENILIDHERHQSVWIENWEQYALKIGNLKQNKWKTNGSKRNQCLWQNCMKYDLHTEKPNKNQH